MTTSAKIPSVRVIAEGATIVASNLLAFAIDARAFYTQSVVAGLADLQDTQVRILQLIEAEQANGDSR